MKETLRNVKSRLATTLSTGRNAFIVHGNADPDALASAFAMNSIFQGQIVAPGGLDRSSKLIAESLGIKVVDEIPEGTDRLVVLDTSGPEQLGKLRHLGSDEKIVVIDHHSRNASWSAKEYLSDDKRSSCCEIVYDIIKHSGKKMPREAALALLTGMLTDTGHFRFGNHETLETFSKIMKEYEIPMHEALKLLESEMDLSERISQLKGVQRLRFTRIEGYIIATSFGSAFEASVSKSLISLGADIAFVGSQRHENFRISARASQDAVDLGIHLGKLLEGIGNETSNGGGGHAGAAGLSGKGDVRDMLDRCVHRSRRALKSLLPASH